jgi:formylglycine-generating enzyme required for sulfatase activity
MGKFEVTNEQYRIFKPDHNSKSFNDISLNEPNQPAVYVNWIDANEFCRWLNKNIRGNFRLPNESEWEYACRAETKTPWHWGDDPNMACEYSNIAGLESKPFLNVFATCECNDEQIAASPVGSYKPNGFGLYDMIGNVWEWCQDNHSESYWGAPGDGSVYESKMELSRVYRGGSWEYKQPPPRAALRNSSPPSTKLSTLGFRCVRDN